MPWKTCLILLVLALANRNAPTRNLEWLASLTGNFSWRNFHNWTDEIVKNVFEILRKGVQDTPPEYWQELIRNVTDVRVWSQWFSDGWQWIKSQNKWATSTPLFPSDIPDDTLPSNDTHFNNPTGENFLNFSNEKVVAEAKSDGIKAMDAIVFKRRKEPNACSYISGIRKDRYNIVVNKIAKLVHLPERIKENLLEAGHARNGEGMTLQDASYEETNGSFHFGRFIVIRNEGGFIDLGYSLANFQYVLAPKGAQNMDKSKDLLIVDGDNLYLTAKAQRILGDHFKVNAVEAFISKYEKLKLLIQGKAEPKEIATN